MNALLVALVTICAIASIEAIPKNIKEIQELPQANQPILEADESNPQSRKERCSSCGAGVKLNLNPLAAFQALPGAEVHSQSSFEGCSSDKGCAGLKVKDGKVVERFGNIEAFKSAAAADASNEFTFHAAGPLAVFSGGIPKQGPFWWMTENSPFKNVHAPSGEKYTQSSSSSFSANSNAGGIDIAANPFLNGDFTKLASGFANTAAQDVNSFVKPQTSYQSSFESSSFSTSNKEVDLSKNPFLNGKFAQSGVQAQFGAPSNAQAFASSSSSSNKYSGSGAGYTGSSPSPFRAGGSSINLVQGSQKNSEFDFEQNSQQNIDEVFQETGNVHAHEHSGGDLQQTCAGQGYVCVHKAQCNNGVVNTNGGGILQAKTKKQYCNIKTEICCRIEISTLPGAGGLQGSLGVGSATYSGSSSQGSGLFSQSGSNQAGSSQGGSSLGGSSQGGSSQSSFGSSSFESQSGSAFGSEGSRGSSGSAGSAGSFGNAGNAGSFGSGQGGYGSTQSSFESSSSSFNSRGGNAAGGNSGNNNNGFASTGQGSTAFGATGQGSSTFGQSGNRGSTGAGAGGVTYESSSSSFESSSFGGNSNGNKFNGVGTNNVGFNNAGSNNVGATASGATASGSNGFATGSGSSYNTNTKNFNTNGYNTNNNEVIKTTKTQTNFIETDSFSSGSETAGVYRPGAVGSGLKPGLPYLPPVDNVNSGTNVVSSTAFSATYNPTTARPVYTPRPTYLPPSTSAPGYLPPVEGEQTINTETRVPNPTYDEGQLLLDETRQPAPRPKNPAPAAPVEIPSGCAAALKCTPVEFCSADGVISTTPVVLTKDQEAFRVPLTDCKDISSGTTGKCCRDPNYSDPWPTNLIGKWTEGVFGGNDGKYTPDSRGSPNSPQRVVTGRPVPAPITGSVVLNNYRTTPRPIAVSPNAVPTTPGSFGQKGQVEIKGQSQFTQLGQGQFAQAGQGQFAQVGQGQFAQTGQGQFAQGSQGQFAQGGKGQFAQGGQGQFAQGGQGQFVKGGQGQLAQGAQGGQSQFSQSSFSQSSFSQKGQGVQGQVGQGQAVSQGQGQFGQGSRGQIEIQEQGAQGQFAQGSRGQGQFVSQGQGQFVSQGIGQGVRQGQGFAVSQGSGFSAENEYSESVQRVFLQRYNAGGECGVFNSQKPYGNRNELEVDFAEIPWQAMILLQTNRSLLCGGVITRPDVVITSASCIQGLEAKDLRIKGGEWKLGVDDEPLPFQIVEVKNVLRHPFFKPGQLQYDAAILVLRENLRLAKNIYPICLPGAQESLGGFYNGAGECIVNGWGKQVLQAHISGAIMHSVNVSLINPGECQAKLQQEYPHLLEQYDQESCACGQPTNPISNICKVDTGSALACTTGDGHFVLRGIYSWDSGCQPGNQLAAFFKFDVEWYEWAIGLVESTRFAQFSSSSSGQRFAGQQINSGIKGSQFSSGAKAGQFGVKGASFQGSKGQFAGQFGQSQFSQFASAGKFAESQAGNVNFAAQAPITNSFASSFSEKKVFQSEPQIVTYTTKPEIVTFTTKPEYFTFTTKPKLVTYTTQPQLITYETSGSVTNPQYVAPGVTYNPAFGGVVAGQHQHNAQCKCLDGKK